MRVSVKKLTGHVQRIKERKPDYPNQLGTKREEQGDEASNK